jgi:hypothetical protein
MSFLGVEHYVFEVTEPLIRNRSFHKREPFVIQGMNTKRALTYLPAQKSP